MVTVSSLDNLSKKALAASKRRLSSALTFLSKALSGLFGEISISPRILRIPTINFFTHSISASTCSSCLAASCTGNACTIMLAFSSTCSALNGTTRCQIVSVINGINGCNKRSKFSSTLINVWRVPRFSASLLASLLSTGLVSSKYQSQNWFQVNSYTICAAMSKR